MHFVDTNVLVYARDTTEPAKQERARDVMRRLWQSGTGRLSHQVLQEFYVTVTRKLKPGLPPDEAMNEVRDLFAWNPVAPSEDLFENAWEIEARWQLSWWDSLIAASAWRAGCSTLLSEDLQDGLQLGSLRVLNPFSPLFDPALLD
jgi:predicted nucleic acid-binding protein